MWAMILLAGVIVIYVIGSISVTGYGNIDALVIISKDMSHHIRYSLYFKRWIFVKTDKKE